MVKGERFCKKIAVLIVAITGSKYDKIMPLPPVSFFTPTLYRVNAKAVGISPSSRMITKSINVILNKSAIPNGRNGKIKKSVDHRVKKASKFPFDLIFPLLLYIFFLEKIKIPKQKPEKIPTTIPSIKI